MHSYSPASSLDTLGRLRYSPGGNIISLSFLRHVMIGRGSPEALQKDSRSVNSVIDVFIGWMEIAGWAAMKTNAQNTQYFNLSLQWA